LTDSGNREEYFWLTFFGQLSTKYFNSETDIGQRLGLLLDIAEELSKIDSNSLVPQKENTQ
jgi:hypothetical protein